MRLHIAPSTLGRAGWPQVRRLTLIRLPVALQSPPASRRGDKMSASARDATPPPPSQSHAPPPPPAGRLSSGGWLPGARGSCRCNGCSNWATCSDAYLRLPACPVGLERFVKTLALRGRFNEERDQRGQRCRSISARGWKAAFWKIFCFFYISANKLIKLSIRSLTHEPWHSATIWLVQENIEWIKSRVMKK